MPAVPAPDLPAEALRSSLHGRGQRLTPQRQRVLSLFERLGEGTHLSAEEVHQRLLRAEERAMLSGLIRPVATTLSVMMVAGLELMSVTSIPSSRSDRAA